MVNTEDDEFISKVARTIEKICDLAEAGYEFGTEYQTEKVKIFRMRN